MRGASRSRGTVAALSGAQIHPVVRNTSELSRSRRVGLFEFGWREELLDRVVAVRAVSAWACGRGAAVCGRASSRSWRSWCCDTNWRSFAVRSRVRGWMSVTASSLLRRASSSARLEPVTLRPSGHPARLASPACAETVDVCRRRATRSPSGRLSRIIPDSGSPLSNVLLVGAAVSPTEQQAIWIRCLLPTSQS